MQSTRKGGQRRCCLYFQRDINSGALINIQQACEIVECLWFKLAELSEVRAACAIDGYPMLDAMLHGAAFDHAEVNELSAMFISAQRNLSALNLPVRLFSGAQQVSHAPFAACADTPVMEG